MRKYFFEPFVGENYLEGIRGKKILVVGASFYCNESSRCQFFKDCTDVTKRIRVHMILDVNTMVDILLGRNRSLI